MVAAMAERLSAVLVLTGAVCATGPVAMDWHTWTGSAVTGSVGGDAS
jgi:hypothetical protein